jgi:hypothetical protein
MIRLCDLHDIPEQEGIGIPTMPVKLSCCSAMVRFMRYRNHCPHLGIDLNFQPDVFMDLDGSLHSVRQSRRPVSGGGRIVHSRPLSRAIADRRTCTNY